MLPTEGRSALTFTQDYQSRGFTYRRIPSRQAILITYPSGIL